jgi:hypothetical protein
MRAKLRLFIGAVTVPLIAALSFVGTQLSSPAANAGPVRNHILARQLAIELGQQKAPQWLQHVSSGAMYTVLQETGILDRRAQGASGASRSLSPSSTLHTQGCAQTLAGTPSNVRVNQDCSLRRQAEETIAINPLNAKNLIAGQNDSRIGFNHCGYDWSFDGGATWGDQLPPFFQTTLLDGHTADACSDPTAAFDSQGNAYAGGIVFDISSAANAILVAKSNAGIGGAFYHSPVSGPFQEYSDTPLGIVANDNNPDIFNDKELLTADAHLGSPKANNVYMTWTRFATTNFGVRSDSPIFFSQSTDGGATWSPGIEVSGSNATACTAFSAEKLNPNACDQDQGSDPIVGPDGKIYVFFGNGNTPTVGVNQHMVVTCPPTADCSQLASWTAPVKITDDFGTQPLGPDSTTGCPSGRQCLPPNGYRLDDFVEGSGSIANNGKLFFAWADYRNGQDSPNCPGLSNAASDTPPCNNDVFYSFSTNGGSTWSGPILVTPSSRFGDSAQWQPWGSVSSNGSNLFVAFYDRHYGTCETDGCNDITLATIGSPTSGSPSFSYTRLTTSSMPNLVPANNPVQAGFLGDYMWVATLGNGMPFVVWADTRGRGGTTEEDVYFTR